MQQQKKGFTLIELIITIAILAVLVTIVVLAINPAEQLSRARDSKRVGDLSTLRSAWNLYLAQATTSIILASTDNSRCKGGTGTDTYFTSATSTRTPPTGFTATSTGIQTVGATGWAPARVDQTPGGAPIAYLPVDPTNTDSGYLFYAYACEEPAPLTYEFTARLESTYFRDDLDLDAKDGGNSTSTYEVGTKLTIIPLDY